MEQLALSAIPWGDYPDEGDASPSDGSGEDEASLDPEAREIEDDRGWTRLHWAAKDGLEEVVRRQLEHIFAFRRHALAAIWSDTTPRAAK